jgi:hypothetical protein
VNSRNSHNSDYHAWSALRKPVQESPMTSGRIVGHLPIKNDSSAILSAGRSRIVSADDDLRRKFRDRQREPTERPQTNYLVETSAMKKRSIRLRHPAPEHANTVGDRFRQRVRSSWFGGLLRWRARTSCHTESGCVRTAFANPVSNFCAGPHPSAPVR